MLVMHEVPGLYPEVVEFGRWVAEAGFTVWMPSVIGTPGKPYLVMERCSGGALGSQQAYVR